MKHVVCSIRVECRVVAFEEFTAYELLETSARQYSSGSYSGSVLVLHSHQSGRVRQHLRSCKQLLELILPALSRVDILQSTPCLIRRF
jgi:hypothetical protein